ncbi:Phist protein [Plasmodium gonderi]|uniref:Phist protein n=1 Tax=Plasmodium gonderi TaxID=77519 RepID=A0A1Y1JE57_PLAGO|nr:Phist protein [Plasmodium gonderi]GAW79605.1 Phist protein [Plasmodium gonderi]
MEFFKNVRIFFLRKQLDENKLSIRGHSLRSAVLYAQAKKCKKRSILSHILSAKPCSVLPLIMICVILQISDLCNGNGNEVLELNFRNSYGRNLSEFFEDRRSGSNTKKREGKKNNKETFMNSPIVEEKEESGGCRYEELETILGGSFNANSGNNKSYYVAIPEDQASEQSEDESESERVQFVQPDIEEYLEVDVDQFAQPELGHYGESGDKHRESEEQYEDSDEEEDEDDDDNDMLNFGKDFSEFGFPRKRKSEDLIDFEGDDLLSPDSDTDTDTDTESRKMLSEEELYKRIRRLRGTIDYKELLHLWNNFNTIENNKFQAMQRHLWNWCELLAFEYKIPEDVLLTEWKRIVDFTSDELMRKTVNDYKDFKELVKHEINDREDFLHFIKHKKESWGNFKLRTETIWKSMMDNKFRTYNENDMD